MANGTDFGLLAAVFTRDSDRALGRAGQCGQCRPGEQLQPCLYREALRRCRCEWIRSRTRGGTPARVRLHEEYSAALGDSTWRRAGLDEFDTAQPPGPSDEKSKAYLENLFAEQIDGHKLLVNNSRWGNFRTWRTHRWHSGNVVLLGDAAHTAHFSVGSDTKMAMENAVALADSLLAHRADLPSALEAHEAARRPSVEKIQGSARPSLSWWEHFGRYHEAFEPTQFAFYFISRSIGKERIARRDPDFVDQVVRDWRAAHEGRDPLDMPFREFGGRRLTADDLAALRTEGCLWFTAPEGDDQLPQIYDRLADTLSDATPSELVAVQGGTALTRSLLAEQARLVHGVPALIVEDAMDDDRAETLLLSGRADLVAGERARPRT